MIAKNREKRIVVILLASVFFLSTLGAANAASNVSASVPQFPVGSGSWNPKVPCSSPWILRVTDITDNMTGSSSLSSSIFSPGITSPVGTAKRWLTPGSTPPGWTSPGPPCTITNSHGTVAMFVEIDGVKRASLVNEDCTGTYDTVNGGGSNGGSYCDSTFNFYDPGVVPNYSTSCTSASDPSCYGRIHSEIDHDWKAAKYCGASTTCDDAALSSQTTTSSQIDFQGFIYWDPGNLNQAWHSFNGWEIHPLTSWRVHQSNPSLTASFNFSPSSPSVGQAVTFTATVSGGTTPYSFSWTFGDGSTGTGSTVTHAYTSAGTFTVALTVKDSGSPQMTASRQQSITVTNPATLTTSFSYSPSSPIVGQQVTFNASASGGTSPYSFSWNFGDGGSATGSVATHVYSASGSYTVTLTTTDSANHTLVVSNNVTVSTSDFKLAANPYLLTISRGQNSQSQIAVTSIRVFQGK